jgi:hypothetical protein
MTYTEKHLKVRVALDFIKSCTADSGKEASSVHQYISKINQPRQTPLEKQNFPDIYEI